MKAFGTKSISNKAKTDLRRIYMMMKRNLLPFSRSHGCKADGNSAVLHFNHVLFLYFFGGAESRAEQKALNVELRQVCCSAPRPLSTYASSALELN
jgi:hypothetical protein